MMLLLNELPKTNSIYFQDDLHNVWVKHFPYFIEKNLFDVIDVKGVTAEIFMGDFHGLLLNFRIPYCFHRVNTEFNNLISPIDYLGEAGSIRVIQASQLEKAAGIFKTKIR